jgi:hypothetical protein
MRTNNQCPNRNLEGRQGKAKMQARAKAVKESSILTPLLGFAKIFKP